MVRRLGLALGFTLWSWGAFAQGLPAHTIPIGEGLTAQGFGIGGPCANNQTLVWSGPTADPTCATPGSSATLSIGTSSITGFMSNAVLYTFPTGFLSQIVPFANRLFLTDGSNKPILSTTVPTGVSYLSPQILNQLSGLNTIPLSTLLQLSARAVVGNLNAAAGNVSAPWVVPNSIDGIIPLLHTVPTVTSGDAVCFNDNLGTIKDCGTALGTAAGQNTGTSGATLPFLNGNNTWSGINVYNALVNFTSSFLASGHLITFPSTTATLMATNLTQQTVSGGAIITPYNPASGSYTVDCSQSPGQWISSTTNAAWSLSSPANDGQCIVQVEIASTGAVPTFAGTWSQGTNVGDSMSVPGSGTNYYQISVVVIHSKAHYLITALQ